MAHDPRVALAAANNADHYQAMFETWGRRYERRPFAFIGLDPPPPYHSNLTILAPDRADDVVPVLRDAACRFDGAVGFKDSFCEYELGANGFETLFRASWTWRAAEAAAPAKGWEKVADPAALRNWEAAWKSSGSPTGERMFRDAWLQRSDIMVWAKMDAGACIAGCIANRSHGCVGLSNLFSASAGDIVEEATMAVASAHPDLPIVGYARGPALAAARRCGHEPIGDLRVLVASHARF